MVVPLNTWEVVKGPDHAAWCELGWADKVQVLCIHMYGVRRAGWLCAEVMVTQR